MRLDQYLHQNGLAQTRQRAQALIMAGQVYLNGEKAEKAGIAVKDGAKVEVRGNDIPYVSRGGLKLEKALDAFNLSPKGLVCMDVGASTGGFTDCMLKNEAEKVYAVDVGYGQLAWELRTNEAVKVMERTNIRHLTLDSLEEPIEFFSIDVSFISLKLVLPVMNEITKDICNGVCLVKPQFEAGKDKVGKNGVVRDEQTHIDVMTKCAEYANNNGFNIIDFDFSPIKGPKGNIEFLMHVRKGGESGVFSQERIHEVCTAAHNRLNSVSNENI